MMRGAGLAGMLVAGTGFLAGCQDIEGFDTSGEGVFSGCLVGAPFAHEGMLREGQPPILQAELELDIDNIFANATPPRPAGTLTTHADQGLCAPGPLFSRAPLRLMRSLQHDPLSQLEFGQGRDYNFMAWVDSTCQGTMLAVVSLMHDDTVELRLLKPAPSAGEDAGAGDSPGFGVFRLDRSGRSCNP